MRFCVIFALFLSVSAPAAAQLSTEQKLNDFQQLAALYTKQYGPYEWKRDVVKFDLMELRPWLDKIRASKSDLEFYEIMAEYVAALNDVHSGYFLPSNFWADTGLRGDIYEGKVLIDSVNRTLLPRVDFPFDVGDEIISVDGVPAMDVVADLARFSSFGNKRSTMRWAAHLLGVRDQVVHPRAHEIGETSTFVMRREGGELETYELTWEKHGRPLTANGKVPSPRMLAAGRIRPDQPEQAVSERPAAFAPEAAPVPSYMRSLAALGKLYTNKPSALRNFGARAPIFTIPNFTQRLGRTSADYFYTGSYTSEGRRIGFIRIPSFSPASQTSALLQLDREIAWMRDNTDGLVVDVMRNPGGSACYDDEVLRRFIPREFRTIAFSIRPTLAWVNSMYDDIELAEEEDAEEWQINLLKAHRDALETAFSENRGLTGPLPLCDVRLERDPLRDRDGNALAYEKPLIVLTDEFTTSAGDYFAAVMQDAKRGTIVGWRTAGAGGNVVDFPVGFYSEGFASVTQSLMVRPSLVTTTDFPQSYYVENIGVRPEVEIDYMTRDNLVQDGRPFVNAFTKAIRDEIDNAK